MSVRTFLTGTVAAVALTAGGLAMTAGTASAEAAPKAEAAAAFTVWATDVNVRDNPQSPATCDGFPSPGNCPVVSGKLQPGQQFEARCQRKGEAVSGNDWWVFIERGDSRGWIASYFVDTPSNQLPGVPVCGA
ncbi:hypothetical protein ACFQ0X_40765 [Streptomyces rectiviolaceus]|uniref:SH3b domain-containing protein n=1 Tax=Streptomyces rectiviolaceus TaxID=332591 RepID=A0ABP6MNW7_9ACTN